MKLLIIFILLFQFISCQQPNKIKSATLNNSLSEKDALPNNVEEDFKLFLEKFSTDSLFQFNCISFPLKVKEINPQTLELEEGLIEIEEYQFKSFNTMQSSNNVNIEHCDQFIKIKNEQAIIDIFGIENGLSITYTFQRRNGDWRLITWTDRST